MPWLVVHVMYLVPLFQAVQATEPKTDRLSRKTDDVVNIDYFPNRHSADETNDGLGDVFLEAAEDRSEGRIPRDCKTVAANDR